MFELLLFVGAKAALNVQKGTECTYFILVSSGKDMFKAQSTLNLLSVQRKQNVSQITLFGLVIMCARNA